MHALVTGMNGTVAPALASVLRASGWRVTPWDRSSDPVDDRAVVERVLERCRPDWVCHVATGSPDWAEWIAQWCGANRTRLMWTSTVSIYADSTPAPLGVDAPALANDDYGRYKADCERRVRGACPSALVPRLGWQIGEAPGSNTMTDYLFRTAREKDGIVEASEAWIPSTAWLGDTATAIAGLMTRGAEGPFQLEGNGAGLSMFDLATAVNRKFAAGWTIVQTRTPAMDRRMHDPRVSMGQVRDRLAVGG
ncbi:MAG: sugar nucleotide-binding protein [Planctomycetes bacterium]|nr:sugar nucleotide-binding protein [Planctomycetota bacterium]